MTPDEIMIVRQTIGLLQKLVPGIGLEPAPAADPACAVTRFAREYLVLEPQSDMSCSELWTFYQEIWKAGELPAIRKTVFLRCLSSVMRAVYGVPKSHNIEQSGRRVRGFAGIGIRLDEPGPSGKPDGNS